MFQYIGSDKVDDVAWYKDNTGLSTRPVALKKPNELGIFDMAGNFAQKNYAAKANRLFQEMFMNIVLMVTPLKFELYEGEDGLQGKSP